MGDVTPLRGVPAAQDAVEDVVRAVRERWCDRCGAQVDQAAWVTADDHLVALETPVRLEVHDDRDVNTVRVVATTTTVGVATCAETWPDTRR